MPGSIFAVIKIWTDSGKPAKKSMDSLLSRINERGWQERHHRKMIIELKQKKHKHILYIYIFSEYM